METLLGKISQEETIKSKWYQVWEVLFINIVPLIMSIVDIIKRSLEGKMQFWDYMVILSIVVVMAFNQIVNHLRFKNLEDNTASVMKKLIKAIEENTNTHRGL